MNKRLYIFLIGLLLLTLLSLTAFAAPPDWAKGKKSKTPLQTITERTQTAPSTTEPTSTQPTPTPTRRSAPQPSAPAPTMRQGVENATTPATGERHINWEAISVALVIIGALIGWLLSRRIRNKSAYYLKEIDATHRRHNDEPEALDAALGELRERIVKDFEKGRLTDSALAMLEGRIDKYSKSARVDTVATRFHLPKDIKRQIKAMLDDGVISEDEYDRFTEMDLTHLPQKEYERLTKLMRKWKGGR